MDILTIFITGLFAGGLTCLAVQGGLLASSVAQQNEDSESRFKDILPVSSFLISRLIFYTLLGFGLGLLGSFFTLSLKATVILQIFVSLFMIGTAFNLLDVHPFFRHFLIQPPKFVMRKIRSESKSKAIFAPAILGALTVLIPCGATQAMLVYAMSTSSPWLGALTMFTFILGTSPLFFFVGFVAKKFSSSKNLAFARLAAISIMAVALFNLNGAINLSGFEAQKVAGISSNADTVSEATIYFSSYGYYTEPEVVNTKAGEKLTLNLVNNDGVGCVQAFTIPSLGVQKIVATGTSQKIVLSTPNFSGKLNFMCSMGMFRGSINVI